MQTQMRSRIHAPDSWYHLVRGCKAVILLTSVAICDHVSQINHDLWVEGVAYLVENSGSGLSGSQQVHKLLSLQPCGRVRTFKLPVLPKVSRCSEPLHDHELDAVEIAADGTSDNRILEYKALLACKPLCRHSCRSSDPT